MGVRSLGSEDPLEEGVSTQSSILAWRIPWTEEPGGLQSMGSQRVKHNWVTKTATADGSDSKICNGICQCSRPSWKFLGAKNLSIMPRLASLKAFWFVYVCVCLQDVVSHSKKLTKKNKEQLSDMMMLNKQKGGLKALSKEKREKLEAYQHLFYLLQVSGSWNQYCKI